MTVLAYGVTGSGKTHTMMGDVVEESDEEGGLAGIIPRAIADVFELIEQGTWFLSFNEARVTQH